MMYLMEELSRLQELREQFSSEAKRFPELHHFVMIWPENKPKPEYPSSYTDEFIKANFCHIGVDIPGKRYKSEYQIWHCAIKPKYCQWDKLRAIRPFQRLAEKVMQFASGYVSQGIMNLNTPLDQWLLSIHELTESKQIFLADAMAAYHMQVTDVFSESAIACSALIDKLRGATKPEQNTIPAKWWRRGAAWLWKAAKELYRITVEVVVDKLLSKREPFC